MALFLNEKELSKNPNVYKVDSLKLILKTDLKIELFKLWRSGETEKILPRLKECGFGNEVLTTGFIGSLITSFKNTGYPVHKREELIFCSDKLYEHPLIRSGKFEVAEKYSRLQIKPDFEKELFSRFPEISVEAGLKNAGIDPADVGYQRIKKLERDFEKKAGRIYSLEGENKTSVKDDGKTVSASGYIQNTGSQDFVKHPYIQDYGIDGITLTENFYNEIYLIAGVNLERILDVYELPKEAISFRNRMMISSKLFQWVPTGSRADESDKMAFRIWHSRLSLFSELIEENFVYIHDMISTMGIFQKRKVAVWIDSLPRDPWGHYTVRCIIKKVGFSKSLYYELIHNKNYGKGKSRRLISEDESIALIRQVAEYKGYKKGYRQISMMMEDVTGKTMSPHRVLYLMRKYGMRTNIRKPSKNRKAMKALMERNGKPNLLERKFRMFRPNEVRLTDVTYLDYGEEQRAYGSASIDPVTGKLVCFVVSMNNDLQLALDTLEAMDEYPLKSGGVIHSDQGILYFTDDFQSAVSERDIMQSMSRRGNCWDNAPQESFFGHFKDECDYKKCRTLEELQRQIDEYRVYYNGKRRLWERGRRTPLEYEAYLEGMDDEAFKEYLQKEEAAYLEKKEKSALEAVEKAKGYRKAIKERLEEIENGKGSKTEV